MTATRERYSPADELSERLRAALAQLSPVSTRGGMQRRHGVTAAQLAEMKQIPPTNSEVTDTRGIVEAA